MIQGNHAGSRQRLTSKYRAWFQADMRRIVSYLLLP
jgi:hypothetical protein